jgi:hypothetical protein
LALIGKRIGYAHTQSRLGPLLPTRAAGQSVLQPTKEDLCLRPPDCGSPALSHVEHLHSDCGLAVFDQISIRHLVRPPLRHTAERGVPRGRLADSAGMRQWSAGGALNCKKQPVVCRTRGVTRGPLTHTIKPHHCPAHHKWLPALFPRLLLGSRTSGGPWGASGYLGSALGA